MTDNNNNFLPKKQKWKPSPDQTSKQRQITNKMCQNLFVIHALSDNYRTTIAIITISEATSMMIMVNRIGQVNHALPRQIIQKTNRVLGAILKQRAHRSPRNQNSNGESITHKKTSPHHRMV
ncbi:unnamed protein product [Trichogramma brassicae]|uniref:Uncharacterized protein n=1 Tax=Trichogramma brassicae TaxID=86971 RepID=A0A6H5IX28_9HYME|nr:unnamed protein product [Trichogramma brassicae]